MMSDEHCRAFDVDGEPVVVHGPRPLTAEDQAMFGDIVRAVTAKVRREQPHYAVIQGLIRAVRVAAACIPDGPIDTPYGERDGATVRSRLKVAAAAAHAALDPAYAERLRARSDDAERG